MVCICVFSPFAYTDTELYSIAARERVFERFGAGERDRINKISNHSGKALSLGGLIALGRALESLGISGAHMPISRDHFGKPRFDIGECEFSISHAGALSVAAVSADGGVGVDIESIDSGRDILRIAKRFFSESERRELESAEDRVTGFYRIWTAKEAMMKLGGEGMVSIMSAESISAEESGERSFARYTVSFDRGEYILTLCTPRKEKTEIFTCEGVSVLRD